MASLALCPRAHRRWCVVAFVVVVAALAGCGNNAPKEAFQGSDVSGARWGRDFHLVDSAGIPRSLADYRGKVVMLFFGYTNCPDECPATLAKMAQAVDRLGSDRARAGSVRHCRSGARHPAGPRPIRAFVRSDVRRPVCRPVDARPAASSGASDPEARATGCASCREEHPLLMQISREGIVPVHGLNYKDQPADAAAWLDPRGDPYRRPGADLDRRVAIDWGVTGFRRPLSSTRTESCGTDKSGRSPAIWSWTLLPLIRSLQGHPR